MLRCDQAAHVVVNVVASVVGDGGPCQVRSGASNMAHRLPTDLKRNRTVRRFGGCFENACHDQHLPLESQGRGSLFRLAVLASKIEAQGRIQASGVSVPQQVFYHPEGREHRRAGHRRHRGWLSQLKRPPLYVSVVG